MKKLIFYFFAILSSLLIVGNSFAATQDIVINEIGTSEPSSYEWVEIYNRGQNAIDLTGWKLQAADGSPEVNLTGTISAGSYFLFERTDDDTVPGVSADQIYTGALGNTSEHLKLHDAKNNLIDEINASDGWPGGDNSTKQTLERASTNRWQTSAEPGGTPRAQNSRGSDSEQLINQQLKREMSSLMNFCLIPMATTPRMNSLS